MLASVRLCHSSVFDPVCVCVFFFSLCTPRSSTHDLRCNRLCFPFFTHTLLCHSSVCLNRARPASMQSRHLWLRSKVCKWISIAPESTWRAHWFITDTFEMWKCRHMWLISEWKWTCQWNLKNLCELKNSYEPIWWNRLCFLLSLVPGSI